MATRPFPIKIILVGLGIFITSFVALSSAVPLAQIGYARKAAPAASRVDPGLPAGEAVPAESSLTISKLNVHTPVIYVPGTDEAVIQKALEGGVIHYDGTAVPGQTGNVAIFGHSSNDWWEPGAYKFVFVLLDKLVSGDQITMDYQSKRYTYEVTGSRVVDPTDLSVLNPTATPTLSLITCTPPGTSLKRLVVSAKQIYPNPSSNVAPNVVVKAGGEVVVLPNQPPVAPRKTLGGREGFMTGVWNLVVRIVNVAIPVTAQNEVNSPFDTPTPSP